MDAVIDRKQTAFRLSCDLLDKMKEAATRENRSLNNYVESVLMDVVYNNPNKLTIKAMREAREKCFKWEPVESKRRMGGRKK